MPVIQYECVHCREKSVRVGNRNDHLTICNRCYHLMVCLDIDIFRPLFDNLGITLENGSPSIEGDE